MKKYTVDVGYFNITVIIYIGLLVSTNLLMVFTNHSILLFLQSLFIALGLVLTSIGITFKQAPFVARFSKIFNVSFVISVILAMIIFFFGLVSTTMFNISIIKALMTFAVIGNIMFAITSYYMIKWLQSGIYSKYVESIHLSPANEIKLFDDYTQTLGELSLKYSTDLFKEFALRIANNKEVVKLSVLFNTSWEEAFESKDLFETHILDIMKPELDKEFEQLVTEFTENKESQKKESKANFEKTVDSFMSEDI